MRGSPLLVADGADDGFAEALGVTLEVVGWLSAGGGLEVSRELAADAPLAEAASTNVTSMIAAGLVALRSIPWPRL